jgi:hypothetical protein
MSKDFDTAPVRQKSSNQVLQKIPQPLTVTEGQMSDGTLYVIPDTPQAYGDEESIAQMAEDYVGLKSDSDEESKVAGELAREQFNTDIRARVGRIRQQQFFSKYPAGMQYIHRDSDGIVKGVTLLFAVWNSETEKTEYIEQHFDAGSLIGQAVSNGRVDLLDKML